jgi:uncharacterized protein
VNRRCSSHHVAPRVVIRLEPAKKSGITGLPQEKLDHTMNSVPSDRPSNLIDPKLLEILVCPLTKGLLEYDAEKQELISRSAKLAYPIRDGIPIMLPEEARQLE